MTLKVIGAGFGRTGTLSIKMALETLGLGPCHHMEEVFTRSSQPAFWRAAVDGRLPDWDEVFNGYHASIDWPSTHYWRELAAFYPQAKILLSVRPAERWADSFAGTIARLLEGRHSVPDAGVRSILDWAYDMIAKQTFGDNLHDRGAVIAAYQRRIDEVTAEIPADRLLVFDVTEGWGPLCGFLELPIPQEEFPRVNNHDEFWQTFGG